MSYYIRNSKGTSGPFDIHELKNQGITKDTRVINQYLYQWTKASEVLNSLSSLSSLASFPQSTN